MHDKVINNDKGSVFYGLIGIVQNVGSVAMNSKGGLCNYHYMDVYFPDIGKKLYNQPSNLYKAVKMFEGVIEFNVEV